jgi:hypothetical protein
MPDAGEEAGDQLNGVLRRGEADALRWLFHPHEHRTRREAVVAADQSVQPLQREREVRAALVVGDGVNLIHDHGAHAGEVLAALAGGQQQVERLRRGDQDVRRMLEHREALFGQSVSGAHGGADLGAQIAALHGELLYLSERAVEVLLHVVGERLERRDIDDLRLRGEIAGERGAQQLVDADQEGSQRLAGAGGRGDQCGLAAQDRGPACDLRLGGRTELGQEPLLHHRMRPREIIGCGERG